MNNYYKDLWTNPKNHGGIFWNQVDFDTDPYRYQEQVFREYLRTSRLRPASVLELGAGTGRMTKIMLEELKGRYLYTIVEQDKDKVMKMFDSMNGQLSVYPLIGDIMEFIELNHSHDYDLILASEVFMHIKPEDISKLISKCSEFLTTNGTILNIDWSTTKGEYMKGIEKSKWCFIHDYDKLYTKNGLKKKNIIEMPEIKQSLFHYVR